MNHITQIRLQGYYVKKIGQDQYSTDHNQYLALRYPSSLLNSLIIIKKEPKTVATLQKNKSNREGSLHKHATHQLLVIKL
jgi:hypothetical protein